jgi:CRP-like cAMP-binding protein
MPRRTATITALTPAQTLTIAGSAFTELRARPAIEQLVVTALVHRVEQLSFRLLEALYVGVDRRVYRRLLELAEIYSPELVVPLSQEDLAMMAGASRPTVNQILQKLVARGIIELGRREITIRDLPALRATAPTLETG